MANHKSLVDAQVSQSAQTQHHPPPELPATGFVRQKRLLLFVPFSKSTLWRMIKKEQFPKPISLATKVTAWRAEEIHHWIQEKRDGIQKDVSPRSLPAAPAPAGRARCAPLPKRK